MALTSLPAVCFTLPTCATPRGVTASSMCLPLFGVYDSALPSFAVVLFLVESPAAPALARWLSTPYGVGICLLPTWVAVCRRLSSGL